ncbi:hypothetical protein KIPB_015275, partial [Kipferlia bialata]
VLGFPGSIVVERSDRFSLSPDIAKALPPSLVCACDNAVAAGWHMNRLRHCQQQLLGGEGEGSLMLQAMGEEVSLILADITQGMAGACAQRELTLPPMPRTLDTHPITDTDPAPSNSVPLLSVLSIAAKVAPPAAIAHLCRAVS